MSTIFTSGATTIAPEALIGYESNRRAQTVLHVVPGKAAPDATLRPASARRGKFRITFQGATAETRAKAAADALSLPQTWACTSTVNPSVNMTSFAVADGDIVCRLDPITLKAWWVEFPFQELT